jgi:hypothetical protein
MTRARDIADSTKTLSVDGGTIKLDGNYPVGSNNVALGDAAFDSVTSGSANVAIGASALTANTSGTGNTGVGYNSLITHSTGNFNTAVGNQSLYNNTTASFNTAVGYQAAYSNTTGHSNVALGYGAAYSNTSATYNTATGLYAGYSNSTGTHNSYYGGYAGYYQLGIHNTAIGYNSFVGASGGSSTGGANTAVGRDALSSNQSANNNTAVGYQAGTNNTTGTITSAGFQAGFSNTTGTNNSFFGDEAGYANTTSSNSAYFGEYSGRNTTGNNNTFYGQQSGWEITTGSKNTILGRYNGNQGGLDIRTSSNNIVLSDGDGNPRVWCNSEGRAIFGSPLQSLGSGFVNISHSTAGNNALVIRTSSTTYTTASIVFQNSSAVNAGYIQITGANSVAYATSSDHRLKENVVELTGATDRLKQLNPSRFNFIADADTTVDGFLAHEVQSVVPEAITGTHNEVDADGNPVYQGIDQSKLVPLLVATIKELEARITALEAV